MKPNPRACIAYIAGCLIANKKSSHVYDYFQSKYISIGGDIDRQTVNVFDYEQGCYLSGEGNDGRYSLFHYGDGNYIDLEIMGNNFEGYDYETGSHYSGEVNGDSISLFDFGESSYFNYSL